MSDTGYLENGQEVVIEHRHDDGSAVVMAVYGDPESEEPSYGRPYYVDKVYDEPPRERYDKVVAELLREQAKLTASLREKEREVCSKEKSFKERLERLSLLDDSLANIERIVNQEQTHYVVYRDWDTPKIVERDPKREADLGGWHDQEYEVMTLRVKNRNFRWEIRRKAIERDDNYDHDNIIPCFSYEEAITVLQRIFDEKIAKQNHRPSEAFVQCAEEYGLTLPDGYRETLAENQRKAKEDAAEKARQEYERAQAALAATGG